MESSPHKPAHLHHVDGLRAVLAFIVLAHHAWLTLWPTVPPNNAWFEPIPLTRYLFLGHFAVPAFIAVSGYCLMLPVVRSGSLRGGAVDFYRRRARRILPPFYAAVLLSYLIGKTLALPGSRTIWDLSVPADWHDLLWNGLLLQHVKTSGQINYALWSVGVEWWIYFIFPLLIVLFRYATPLVTAVVVAVGSLLLAKRLHGTALDGVRLHFVGVFCFGMFAAVVEYQRHRRLTGLLGLAALTAAIVFLALVYRWNWQRPMPTLFADMVVGLTVSLWMALAGRAPDSLTRKLFGYAPLAFVGTFSYSFYLLHAPLLQLAWLWFTRPLKAGSATTLGMLTLSGTVLTLVVAYGFFWLVERPFMSGRQRHASREELPLLSTAASTSS